MSEIQREIYNTIIDMPEEMYGKILDYLEYLKFTMLLNKAPEELIVKSEEDLMNKIMEGIKDTDNGNVLEYDEAVAEIKKSLCE